MRKIEIIKKKRSLYDIVDDYEAFFNKINTYEEFIREMKWINYHNLKLEFFITKLLYKDLNEFKLEIEFLSELWIKNIAINTNYILNKLNFDLMLEWSKNNLYFLFFEQKCSKFKWTKYKWTEELDFLFVIEWSEEVKQFFIRMFEKLNELIKVKETKEIDKKIIETCTNKIINSSLIIKENDFKNYKNLLFTERNQNEQ